MGDKDHLFSLIRSLKKTEKSYFKKIKSAFGNEDSALLQIFSAIQKQEDYDEKKILESLDKEAFRDFFASKKHVLYSEILDVLVYCKTKSPDILWQINRLISHALLLKEKMLFDDSYKTLQKAYKLAKDNEFFYKQTEINQQLIEIQHQQKTMTDFEFSENIESIRLDTVKVNEQFINSEKYFILSDNLFKKGEMLRVTSNETIKDEMLVLYRDPLLNSESKAISQSALVCFHFIHYVKYMGYELNPVKACHHLKKMIEIQNSLKRFSLRSRIVQMANYVRITLDIGMKEEAFTMLQKMKEGSENDADYFVLVNYLVHQDYFYRFTNNIEDYRKFHLEMEQKYEQIIDGIPFNKEVLDVKHAQFIFNFMDGQYKKVYQISNFLDTQYSLHSFKNAKLYEKILKLICAIELDDYDLIQSEIRAVKYLLKSIEDVLPVEVHIFDALERYVKADSKDAKKVVLTHYLESYSEKGKPEKSSYLVDGFGFNIWVKSKLSGEKFITLRFLVETQNFASK